MGVSTASSEAIRRLRARWLPRGCLQDHGRTYVRRVHPDPTGDPYLEGALGVAAMAITRSSDTYFAAKVPPGRRPVRAIVAVEHAMLIAIWNIGTTAALYDDPGADYFTRLHPDRAKNRAIEQLRSLGYHVTLDTAS